MKKPNKSLPCAQHGAVLLIMFMVIFLAGASLFITFASNNLLNQQAGSDSVQALVEAKETLIGYAVLHGDYYGATGAGPGHLLCPDTNGNGSENIPCGINALGRLPLSVTVPAGPVIPLSTYGSGIDERLWYAVANPARRTPMAAFNTTTTTNLTLDGQANMAAVLLDPGEMLSGQIRTSTNDANYLELSNVGGPNYISRSNNGPDAFNDRAVGITVAEIMTPVSARIAETIKTQLDAYHTANGGYPADQAEFDAALLGAPAWFSLNDWQNALVTTYTQLTVDTASVVFTNCNITYTLNNVAGTITRTGTSC